MKKSAWLLAGLIALCATPATVTAQAAELAPAPADTRGVDDALNRLDAAMLAGNEAQLRALTASTLSYGHSSGHVQDQDAFIQTIVGGQTRYTRIDLSHVATTLDGDTAVVRNHFSGTIVQADKTSDVDFDVLMVWRNRAGQWQLIARQGYKH